MKRDDQTDRRWRRRAVAVFLSLLATTAPAQEWEFQVERDQMDDSVSHYVVMDIEEDRSWQAGLFCSAPTALLIGWTESFVPVDGDTIRLRFDKGPVMRQPSDGAVNVENRGILWLVHDEMERLLLENVVLRVEIPGRMLGWSGGSSVVLVDLFTFNQAWEQCPE